MGPPCGVPTIYSKKARTVNALAIQKLLEVDSDSWSEEVPLIENHLKAIGDRLPEEMTSQLDYLKSRIGLES